MKYAKLFSFLIGILLCAISTCSCNEEKELSQKEIIKANLIDAIWKIKSVYVDGVDYTNFYSGMTITFNETSYSATNGGVVWPASGTWQFNSSDGTKIIRGDGLEITLSVTASQLDMLLFWPTTTYGGGRTKSITGNHVFTFSK
jgi:hypothetical protein